MRFTGIDLFLPAHLRQKNMPSVELLEVDFASFQADRGFDAVIATQTLYYLGDPRSALGKLVNHTHRKGILLVTVWTDNSVLYTLHERFCAGRDHLAATANSVADILRNIPDCGQVDVVLTPGEVNLSAWRDSDEISAAAYKILSRADPAVAVDMSKYQDFQAMLKTMPARASRENGTVVFRWKQSVGTA